jgi:hypothetical protein
MNELFYYTDQDFESISKLNKLCRAQAEAMSDISDTHFTFFPNPVPF